MLSIKTDLQSIIKTQKERLKPPPQKKKREKTWKIPQKKQWDPKAINKWKNKYVKNLL